jgi:outer membrane protein assembly factor BamB
MLADGTLHVATNGDGLHALHAATGDPRWSLHVGEPAAWSEDHGEYEEVETPFILAGGTLYARTDRAVIALR